MSSGEISQMYLYNYAHSGSFADGNYNGFAILCGGFGTGYYTLCIEFCACGGTDLYI